jgi:hypothetical protein
LPDNPSVAYSADRVSTGSSAFFVARTLMSSPLIWSPACKTSGRLVTASVTRSSSGSFSTSGGATSAVSVGTISTVRKRRRIRVLGDQVQQRELVLKHRRSALRSRLGSPWPPALRPARFPMERECRHRPAFCCRCSLLSASSISSLRHVHVAARKDKFPIGVSDRGDRGNHLLQRLIGYVLVHLGDEDVMLIGKQSETVQQLLVGGNTKLDCHEGAEKVAGAGGRSAHVIESRRKGSAGVKSLGIGEVAGGRMRIQLGKLKPSSCSPSRR